jgi:hypothetical protein
VGAVLGQTRESYDSGLIAESDVRNDVYWSLEEVGMRLEPGCFDDSALAETLDVLMEAFREAQFVDRELLLRVKLQLARIGEDGRAAGVDAEAEFARIAQALACPVLEQGSTIRVSHVWHSLVAFWLDVREAPRIPVPPGETPAVLPILLAFPGDGTGTAARLTDYRRVDFEGRPLEESGDQGRGWNVCGRAHVFGSVYEEATLHVWTADDGRAVGPSPSAVRTSRPSSPPTRKSATETGRN